MYRFLDKRFYLRPDWEFDLKEFAFEHVGLSRNYASNAGKIKEKLQPALDELEAIDFLQPLPRDERYRKNGREWTIRLGRHGASGPPAPEPPAGGRPAAVAGLVARGVTEATAADLARHFPADAIAAKVEVFDWLIARKDPHIRLNAAGYLVDSIRKDYAPPRGFESQADRARRVQTERAAEQAAAKSRHRKLDEEARLLAELEAIEEYWRSLTPLEQERLDAEALAEADPESWQSCRHNPALARMYRRSLRHDLIRKRLERP
jgi:hypothetical protein